MTTRQDKPFAEQRSNAKPMPNVFSAIPKAKCCWHGACQSGGVYTWEDSLSGLLRLGGLFSTLFVVCLLRERGRETEVRDGEKIGPREIVVPRSEFITTTTSIINNHLNELPSHQLHQKKSIIKDSKPSRRVKDKLSLASDMPSEGLRSKG